MEEKKTFHEWLKNPRPKANRAVFKCRSCGSTKGKQCSFDKSLCEACFFCAIFAG